MRTTCFGNPMYGFNHEHRFTENWESDCNEGITTLGGAKTRCSIATRSLSAYLLFLAVFPARNPKSKLPRPGEHCQGGGSGRRGHDLDRRRRAVQ
jgi:hypothetical protein